MTVRQSRYTATPATSTIAALIIDRQVRERISADVADKDLVAVSELGAELLALVGLV